MPSVLPRYLNRITSAAETSGFSQTFSYDPWGNMQQSGTLSFGVSANANNQIYDPSHTSWYYHDAAGNMLSYYDGSSIQSYTYDADERMLTGGGYTYTYDALGQRVKKGNGASSTEYIYFGGTAIAEKDQAGNWTDYIFAGGKRIAKATTLTSSTGVTYYHGDHLGSARMMTDSTGANVREVTYYPFGSEYSSTGTDHYDFTDMEHDSETNLNHTLFRQQSPTMGRWMSPDPYMGSMDLTNPQSLNRYAYVNNDPVAWMDPDGLDLITAVQFCTKSMSISGAIDDHPTVTTDTVCSTYSFSFANPPIPRLDLLNYDPGTTCPAAPYKITGIAPKQAPGKTAISLQPRKQIQNGGVAIKPQLFGPPAVNDNNRSAFLGISFTADWSTAQTTLNNGKMITSSAPKGIPTLGPFSAVDVIGGPVQRNMPGNQLDVYNYKTFPQANAATRTVMVTAHINPNTKGVTCP